MESIREKKLSKIYRKLLTSNELKALLIYHDLSDDFKRKIKMMLNQNGSRRALDLLNRLQ
jgi:hypothetical protein